MANDPIAPANPPAPAAPVVAPVAPVPSLLDDPKAAAPASADPEKTILEGAIDEKAEAENKRLLEADPKTLSAEELAQRKTLEDAKAAAAPKVVPEKYDLKIPENMKTDTTLLDKMTPVFKELGLTGEQAQKLVDIYAPYVKGQAEASQKAFKSAMETNFKNFQETERKNTMEKLGANAKEDLVFAARTRDRFLSKESQEILNIAGIANNFHFISDLIKIGKQVSEAKLVEGSRITSDARSDGEIIYGKTK